MILTKTITAAAFASVLLGPALATAAMPQKATAAMHDRNGDAVGTVTLENTPNGTLLHADLKDLPEGTHAFHVHSVGTCKPPFKSAGGHFNPTDAAHGLDSEKGPHAGDMPNIHVPASGKLEFETFDARLRLNDTLLDSDGAAIVIHEGADDYHTNPAGAAGPRIACGVIEG